MRPKIFLHMGSHKTGTTSLQATLAKNRSVLRDVGLVYPDLDNADSHFQWARALAGEAPQIAPDKFILITEGILSNLRQHESLLLSAESFYRHINDQLSYIHKIQAVFGKAEITPVVCLRNQGEYAKSLYSEWVLNWQYQHHIYKFIQDFYDWFDYEGFLAKISLLGDPVLISYHEIAGSHISSNFLKQLGYVVELTAYTSYLRESPSDAEVYLKRLLNQLYPQIKYRKVVTEAVKKVVSTSYPELKTPMPFLIWSGGLDAVTFERCYRLANIRLCEQYGKDKDTFFPVRNYRHREAMSAEIWSKLNDARELILEELIGI